MIFRSSGFGFTVYGINVTIEIWVVILVDSSESFGNFIFFFRPRWIEDAEFFTVGRDQGYIMTAFCKKTYSRILWNANVSDDYTARAEMLDPHLKIVSL